MDRHDWDERYHGESLVWSAEPNRFLMIAIDALVRVIRPSRSKP